MIPCFGMHKICWPASAKSTIAANESNKADSGFDCNWHIQTLGKVRCLLTRGILEAIIDIERLLRLGFQEHCNLGYFTIT